MHPFRFGVIAAPTGSGEEWTGTARRVVDGGFSTLLSPDGTRMHAPFPALATAAAVAPDLRVGTFVLAAPLRPARSAAWEAHSLSELSGGRFEFGIGTGRPDARDEAESFGLPWGSASDRLDTVRRTIADLRELDGDRRTPVLMAAAGPKAMALAAEQADIVALATSPLASRAELAELTAGLREREPGPEIAANLFVVGDETPPWVQKFLGADPAELDSRESLAVLRGSPREMADELERRRDQLGVSYFVADSYYLDALAPVVELLAGK